MKRVHTLVLKWVDHGYGVPRLVHVIYLVKLVNFYTLGGIVIATATAGLPAFWHVSQWWAEPILYQKAILWTVLLETIGLAGSWGPLAGKTKPHPGMARLRLIEDDGSKKYENGGGLAVGMGMGVRRALPVPLVHDDCRRVRDAGHLFVERGERPEG